jgi:protein-S-isoprenylcysteine O-methyltransferase Ste14
MAQTAPPPPGTEHDWTTVAADRIESVVTTVRDKTTVPVQKVAAAIVYGLVAGLLGATALVLLVVGLFRLHVYLPFHPEGRRVWISYAGMGAIFVALGGFLWRKRTAQPRE